jgi:tetratricopeptide (TPR) repeat protein
MELLERDDESAALAAALDASRAAGRVVVVTGEAGIGKTALVASVCDGRRARRVLWGACDPLVTPRPMGPLWDVAREVEGSLLQLMERGASREELLPATLDELAASGSSVLVIEDLHWADDASLDLIALLARRLVRRRGCLVMTCRTDARTEVRRVLGALPGEGVHRIELAPLSEHAVELLRTRAGRDAPDLYALSGGNPFFVSEALATAQDGTVPLSVRDALAQRVTALDPEARAVIELAAVVPGATELWLPAEAAGASAEAIDACVDTGILSVKGQTLAFRHELARRAVEDAIPPIRRRALERSVLQALESHGGSDSARLVHHARRAEDERAIRRLAPLAAEAASAAGGHRQALAHWEAALAAQDRDDAEASARALEGVSVEAYLCGRHERALEARRALLALHEAAGDAKRAGDDLRWLSRVLWWSGHGAAAEAAGDRAIAIPGEPRAGDGAQRACAIGDARRAR